MKKKSPRQVIICTRVELIGYFINALWICYANMKSCGMADLAKNVAEDAIDLKDGVTHFKSAPYHSEPTAPELEALELKRQLEEA